MKQKTQTQIQSPFKSVRLSLMAALIMGSLSMAHAQTYSLSNIWAMVGTTNNLDTSADNRSLNYAGSSNGTPVNLVLVNNKGTHALNAYDGATGNFVTAVNSNNLSGGNFTLNKFAVTSAGQLLGASLTTGIAAGAFKIYNWGDWQAGANVSYTATTGDALMVNLSGKRIGDSFAYTGSGTNTLLLYGILLPSNNTSLNSFALFSTTDGTTFTPTVLSVPSFLSGVGGVQFGFAFYTNNTFMVCPNGAAGKAYLLQFPANFASQVSPVTATVIATNTFPAVNFADISYNPSNSLLALHGNSFSPIYLYSMSPTGFSSPNLLATTNLSFTTTSSINGNETGDIALGGTNGIYTLDTSAGVQATSITFAAAPLPPSIVTAPAGATVYTNIGSYTFTVSAGGSAPLSYQWKGNSVSNAATATNIPGATNTTFTISPLTTSSSGWYDVVVSNVAGVTNSAPVQLSVITALASASVTQLWSLPADNSQPYLDTAYNTRGLAYDPITLSVLLAEHSGDNVYALNATNGSFKFATTDANTGLPTGSLFNVGQVGVADDGVVFISNVSSYQNNTTSDNFTITRFDSVRASTNSDGTENEAFEYAFVGDPGNSLTSFASSQNWAYSSGDRWGDSMAVRGAGTNTQILLGTYESITSGGAYEFGTGPGTNVAILTTSDGTNFVATTIICFESDTPTNTPPDGFSYLGVAWGAGNTFWTKSPGYDLRQFSFNITNGTATNLLNFATTAGSGSLANLDGIGLDVSNNILAGVNLNDTPNDLELFQIPTLGLPPQAYFQDFFASYNANINGNAATAVKYPYIFSLDANNGIIGLQYSIPLLPFNIVYTNTHSSLVLTWQTVIGHTYQLQSASVLNGTNTSWSNVGSAVTVPSSGSLSYTNTGINTGALYYQIKSH